jgi:hypothetical protein
MRAKFRIINTFHWLVYCISCRHCVSSTGFRVLLNSLLEMSYTCIMCLDGRQVEIVDLMGEDNRV